MNSVLKEKLAWTEPDAELERVDQRGRPTGRRRRPGRWRPAMARRPLALARRGGRDPLVAIARNLEEPAAPGLFWFSDTHNWRAEVSRRSSSCRSTTRASAGSRRRPKMTSRTLAHCHRPGTSLYDRGDLASHDLAPTGDTTREGRRDRTGQVSPRWNDPLGHRRPPRGRIRHRRGAGRWPADADRLAGGSTGR